MGGQDHIRADCAQQFAQPAPEQADHGHLIVHVPGQAVIGIVQPAHMGHQKAEAPIHGVSQLRQGVLKEIHQDRLVSLRLQLSGQGLGGRPVAHAKFPGKYQNLHGSSSSFRRGGCAIRS